MSRYPLSFIIFGGNFLFLNYQRKFLHGKSHKLRRHLISCLNLFSNFSQKYTNFIFIFHVVIKHTLIFHHNADFQNLTFRFQFILACFPETSESFSNKSLGRTLPRVKGSPDVFVDCMVQRSPREGPDITSSSRLLPAPPALLTERYDGMFYIFPPILKKNKKNINLFL